jgi:hypothetical protein
MFATVGDLDGSVFQLKTDGPPCQSVSVLFSSTRYDLLLQYFLFLPVYAIVLYTDVLLRTSDL